MPRRLPDFVYGRTRLGPSGAHGRQKQRRRSPAEWRIVVKGRYPAYVDWETFERIGAMLADTVTAIHAVSSAARRAHPRW